MSDIGVQGGEGTGVATGRALRCCVVTRLELPPEELIRFVAGPDGQIVPDLARRLPGRGVWVTCDRTIIAQAIRTRAFARSLKRPVEAPTGLVELIGQLLRRRALEGLAIANKAGLVVTGFSKVEEAVRDGGIVALLHAEDAARDGAGKLDRKQAALAPGAGPAIRVFTSDELSLALGRPSVVHAALKIGGSSRRLIEDVRRLGRYAADVACAVVAPPTDKDDTVKA